MGHARKTITLIWRVLLLTSLLAAMWLPALGFGSYAVRPWVSITVPVGIVLTIMCIVRWKSALALSALLLSPVAVFFAFGISDWFSFKPQFFEMGYPGIEFFNLDPATRCYNETGGCIAIGGEWLREIPHNAGLKFTCAVFSPPPHTYHGPYPTLEEALSLTTNAPATPIQKFLGGQVVTSKDTFEMGKQTIEDLLHDLGNVCACLEFKGIVTEIRADVIQHDCLVIRVRTTDNIGIGGESDGVYFFDVTQMRPFARFVLKGHAPTTPRLLIQPG